MGCVSSRADNLSIRCVSAQNTSAYRAPCSHKGNGHMPSATAHDVGEQSLACKGHVKTSHRNSHEHDWRLLIASSVSTELLELCSHVVCIGPDLYDKTGRLPFVAVDVPRWSAFLQPREEVCQRLSLAFLQMRTITRIKKLSWTACAAACRPF